MSYGTRGKAGTASEQQLTESNPISLKIAIKMREKRFHSQSSTDLITYEW